MRHVVWRGGGKAVAESPRVAGMHVAQLHHKRFLLWLAQTYRLPATVCVFPGSFYQFPKPFVTALRAHNCLVEPEVVVSAMPAAQ